jgi:hypothetical protein
MKNEETQMSHQSCRGKPAGGLQGNPWQSIIFLIASAEDYF